MAGRPPRVDLLYPKVEPTDADLAALIKDFAKTARGARYDTAKTTLDS